jgi:transposase-like protein
VGLTCFDGHPSSEARPSKDVRPWRAWEAEARPCRLFTPEFRAGIVEPARGPAGRQVARDFDLAETVVREWVKQAERDAGYPR